MTIITFFKTILSNARNFLFFPAVQGNEHSTRYTSPAICCDLDVCSVVNKIGSARRTSPSFCYCPILAACSVVGFRSLTATSASAQLSLSLL